MLVIVTVENSDLLYQRLFVIRWLVWSLASLERKTGLPFLNPASLVDRLKLRYDREEGSGRSVLRRVLEKDVGAGVPMVLVVAEVSSTNFLLTDGWYSLPCSIDAGTPFQQLFQRGKLVEGTKVVTQGAELLGGEEGAHPLQAEGRSLKLHVNSTRRVRWNTRLGQCAPIAVGLGSLLEGGGATAMLRLRVVRRYPMMFCVKDAGGRSRFLTEKEWEAMRSRAGGGEGVQKIYCEVEEMVKKEEGIVGQKLKVKEKDLVGVECGEELLRLVTASGDPGLVACLNQEQREAMEEAGRRQSERVRSKVEEVVQERLREERRGAEASPMLRVRIVDARQEEEEEGTNSRCSGLLTVWRPTGEADMLKEGRSVVDSNEILSSMLSILPTGLLECLVQL